MSSKVALIALPLFAISGLFLYEALEHPANAKESGVKPLEPTGSSIWNKITSIFSSSSKYPFDPDDVLNKSCVKYSPLSGSIIQRVLVYRRLAEYYGRKYGVPPALILAIIAVESAGNPRAYRYERHLRDASRGLMQMLCSTARRMGLRRSCSSLYNPSVSIAYGAKYLRYLYNKLGDWFWVIAAYNAGERVSRYNRYCFRNQLYVNKVVSALKELKSFGYKINN